jgi:hypothetical protein
METPEFMDAWNQFLNNLRRLGHYRLNLREEEQEEYKALDDLLDRVIDSLLKDDAMTAVRQAVDTENRSTDGEQITTFLGNELQFFNSLVKSYDAAMNSTQLSESAADEALGAGKTIKESLEGLLESLPKWIKKILKVLNELLSLIGKG